MAPVRPEPVLICDQFITLALEELELSPRELTVRFTDERRYFASEATIYQLLGQEAILQERGRIKRQALMKRSLHDYAQAS